MNFFKRQYQRSPFEKGNMLPSNGRDFINPLALFTSLLILGGFFNSAMAADDNDLQANVLAFTNIGPYIAYQYGAVYSPLYGNEVQQYSVQSLVSDLGLDTASRISVGYNATTNIAFEISFDDTGVAMTQRNNDVVDSGFTQQSYEFDIYNLEFMGVLKNNFQNSNTNIYTKFGFAYSYGNLAINYTTTAGLGPSWNNYHTSYNNTFSSVALVPLFDVGAAWSANRYLAFTLDYERSFNPLLGEGNFHDPENSSLQPINMVFLGVLYSF
jgi:hypothetical protein